jgi:hypothetical protein
MRLKPPALIVFALEERQVSALTAVVHPARKKFVSR